MKKILALVACLSLVASLAIGGSIAYLTDRDSEANVFTMGNVEIDLTENYEHLSELLPGTEIKKEAVITNVGENDAYVWMTIAVPSSFDDPDDASVNPIHWNVPGAFWEGYHDKQKYIDSAIEMGYLPAGSTGVDVSKTWNVDDKVPVQENVEIEGRDYNVYTLLYNSAIKPEETTNIGLNQVYMDKYIDINTDGEMYRVVNGSATALDWNINDDGNPTIYVSAYAIQSEGFDTVLDAYNGYQGQWGTNGTEYAEKVYISDNADDVQEELAAGGTVNLDADVSTTSYTIPANVTSNVNLNDKTMTGTMNNAGTLNVSGGTMEMAEGRGFTNAGTATLTDVTMNSGSAATYSNVTTGADAKTTYNNVEIQSAGGGVAASNGAQVVFNSGSLDINTTSTSGRYLFYADGEGSTITINGGSFDFNKTQNQKRAYICAMDGTTVYVTGGTFGKASTRSGYTAGILTYGSGKVIITGGTFGFDPTTWVADGYQAVKNGTTWTVSAE